MALPVYKCISGVLSNLIPQSTCKRGKFINKFWVFHTNISSLYSSIFISKLLLSLTLRYHLPTITMVLFAFLNLRNKSVTILYALFTRPAIKKQSMYDIEQHSTLLNLCSHVRCSLRKFNTIHIVMTPFSQWIVLRFPYHSVSLMNHGILPYSSFTIIAMS